MNRRPAQIGPREKYLVVIPGIVPHGGYFYVSNEDMADYLDTVKSDGGRVDGTAVVLPTAAYPNPSSTGPGTATLLRDLGRKLVLANPDGAHRIVYTYVQECYGGSIDTYWVPTYSADGSLATPFARVG